MAEVDPRQHGKPAETQPSTEVPKRVRRPYVPPVFKMEKVFETMALSCGKISSTQAQCKFNKKSS